MNHLVLFGDSIFDNARYVPGGPSVTDHLRRMLPKDSQVSLLAVDGAGAEDVPGQLEKLPKDSTHLVVSAGGNNALEYGSVILHEPAESFLDVLSRLTEIREEFRQTYRHMLRKLLEHGLPLTVCTIYDSVPGLRSVSPGFAADRSAADLQRSERLFRRLAHRTLGIRRRKNRPCHLPRCSPGRTIHRQPHHRLTTTASHWSLTHWRQPSMPRFNFRLTALLKLRRNQRDICQQRLTEGLARDAQMVEMRMAAEKDRSAQLNEIRELSAAGDMNVDGAAARRYFATQLTGDLLNIEHHRRELAKYIGQCRQALMLADQAVKALEKLEENQRIEFNQEQERRAGRELEETWQARHHGDRQ